MAASLIVERFNLAGLFADRFSFSLPWYQRSYAWSDEHARGLLEDIRGAAQSKDGWYLLGPIILTQCAYAPATYIIDGQQRLITLSILIAVLRDAITDRALSDELHARLWQDHSTPEQCRRLDPKQFIGQTMCAFVQERGGTVLDPDDIVHNEFNDGERNIIENRNALREMLKGAEQRELMTLAHFLLNKCYLVVQIVDNERIAIHIFVKAQDSGLRLAPTDMLKVSVLNYAQSHQRDDCARIWDSCAARLGDEGLGALLHQLCNIRRGGKQTDPLEIDLINFYNIKDAAAVFITDVLQPMTDIAMGITHWSVGKCQQLGRASDDTQSAAGLTLPEDRTRITRPADARPEATATPQVPAVPAVEAAAVSEQALLNAINRHLQYLSWIKHSEWRAPALHWLANRRQDRAATLQFFRALERFAFVHMLVHTQIPRRTALYRNIVRGIDDGTVLNADGPLKLTKAELADALDQLQRPKFFLKHYKTQVFLRANGAAEGDERVRKAPMASIEHIYPKNPLHGSGWKRGFKNAHKAAGYVHRLGNLTPLTVEENLKAGAQEFATKQKIYAQSPFKLSREIAAYDKWDYAIIDARTQMIVDLLASSLKLQP